jgi:mRNA interferase MazF
MTKAIRGEIWQARFWPTVGAEISKDRPAVIINQPGAGRLPLSIVVPITDWKEHYASYFWFVQLDASQASGLSKPSGADAFQVRSMSDDRLLSRLGILEPRKLYEIAQAIRMCVGA